MSPSIADLGSMMADKDFDRIKKQVRQFVVERDWDQFHSPKNLSMALSVEVAELVEVFMWLKNNLKASTSSVKAKSTSPKYSCQ